MVTFSTTYWISNGILAHTDELSLPVGLIMCGVTYQLTERIFDSLCTFHKSEFRVYYLIQIAL